MSSQQAEQTTIEDPELEKRVADYLLSHPDFFHRNLDVLAAIQAPHLVETGAVSLIEQQVRVLRKELDSERNRLTHLISRAREYEALSARLHNLTLRLMAVSDPEHLCGLLREAVMRELRAEAVTLKMFAPDQDDSSERAQLIQTFGEIVDKRHTLCGPIDEARSRVLFGEGGASIKAAALVPIKAEARSGILAIGSSDADRFHPDMGTDFLDRLGEIVSHKLRSVALECCP